MTPVVPMITLLAVLGLGVGLLATGQEADSELERVATLRHARSVHTATTLGSAEVLFVGGMVQGGRSIDAVELFDPTTNTTRSLPPLDRPRASHTATLLDDGTVLIAGGYDGDYLASMHVFDPASGRFRAAGTMVRGRSGHTATLLPDGRVLLVGGVGDGWTFLRSAELYDPVTGRSHSVGNMQVQRESHTATLLADGSVLIVGGHTGRRQAMVVHASAERFVPGTARFEAAGELATARHKHDAVALLDGRVLVVGGADRSDRVHYRSTELFDPTSSRFAPGPEMTHRRYKIAGASVLLPSGEVLVGGGARRAEVLSRDAGAFREVAGELSGAWNFATASLLPGGEVVIAGGYGDGIRNTDGIWRFRPR